MSSSPRYIELHDNDRLIVLDLEEIVRFDLYKSNESQILIIRMTDGDPYDIRGKNASRIYEELKIHLRRRELMT
jgi:hypothetical protein